MPRTSSAFTFPSIMIQVYSKDVNTIGVYTITVGYINYYNTSVATNFTFNVSIVCTPIITYTYTGLTVF